MVTEERSYRFYEDPKRVSLPKRLIISRDGTLHVVWDDTYGYSNPKPATSLDIDQCLRFLRHMAEEYQKAVDDIVNLREEVGL